MYKLSNYLYKTGNLEDLSLKDKEIIFSTRTSLSILISKDMLCLLEQGQIDEIPKDVVKKLKDYKILVPDEVSEFDEICKENEKAKGAESVLSLTIQPTSNCQFGCHYCGQTHTNHTISDEVEDYYIQRIKNVLDRTNGKYKKLSITWYGGEPLLGLKKIRTMSEKLFDICSSYGLKYKSDMVTNGYLLTKNVFLEMLTKYKVNNYQITIDGTSKTHDMRRVLKVNRGATFNVIYNNLKEIVMTPEYDKNNACIQVRINIDRTNYLEVDELISMLIKDKISDKVVLSFAPIEDWGGNDAGKFSFSHHDFSKLHIGWLKRCIENRIKVQTLIPSRKICSCMVESEHNEVFDAFGNVYPCWEFPYSAYKGKENTISTISEKEQEYNKNIKLKGVIKGIKEGSYECKYCKLYPLCGGGCPLALYEGRNACPSYKFDLTERLLLDYELRKRIKYESIK